MATDQDGSSDLFSYKKLTDGTKIWYWSNTDNFATRPGAMAVAVVDFGEIRNMFKEDGTTADTTARKQWLDENAQYLSINCYTGQLFPRNVAAPPAP